jgi:hypothetical protein
VGKSRVGTQESMQKRKKVMKRTNKRSYEFNDRTIHIHEQTRKTKQKKRKQQAEMKEETKEQIQEQEQEDTKKT